MKNISVIIPHYPFNGAINLRLKRCVGSLKGQSEIIVIVNEGTGFGKAVNTGFRLASGDYFAVINNDVYLECGNLQDLAQEDAVMSATWGWAEGPAYGYEFHPSFFIVPRWVYDKVGGFDEQFTLGDYEDNDFYERCKREGIPFRNNEHIRFYGDQGFTKRSMKAWTEATSINQEKFVKKWGKLPDKLIETPYESRSSYNRV